MPSTRYPSRLWSAVAAAAFCCLAGASAAEISFEILADTDAPGNDYQRINRVTLEACQARCRDDEKCAAFTYNERRKVCFLKNQPDPPLSDYRGATTGLKRSIQELAPEGLAPEEAVPEEPAAPSGETDAEATPPLPERPTEAPVAAPEPEIAPAAGGCTLFDLDFTLIRNPNVVLRFNPIEDGTEADKARMIFYDGDKAVLEGRLTVDADRFQFVEDGDGAKARSVTILDAENPSGNSIREPLFVVVGGLPFDGGAFRRVDCETP